MSDQPAIRKATFPPDYGLNPGSSDDRIDWEVVEEKLRISFNYWLTTISPDGRPHSRPVDGVWVEGALVFGGSPETRWVRNLQQNPASSVHLASGEDVVILEGDVELVVDADHPVSLPSREAQHEKYPQYFPEVPEHRPFWMLQPSVAYAWTLEGFPAGATRWTFNT